MARHNPLYREYVEGERQRLGEDHPLFRSQYLLLPVLGEGGLLGASQQAQLQGGHSRRRWPEQGKTYVAALDMAGGVEGSDIHWRGAAHPAQARRVHGATPLCSPLLSLTLMPATRFSGEPQVKVVEHVQWTGVSLAAVYPQLVDLLKRVWNCRRVVVDATGLGQGPASFLERVPGQRPSSSPFVFTAQSKSRLGFDLLAAVNSGRLKMYAPDGSPEYVEFWEQMARAEAYFRPNRTMNFHVDPKRGHDDYLASLALLVQASRYAPRVARGHSRNAAREMAVAAMR